MGQCRGGVSAPGRPYPQSRIDSVRASAASEEQILTDVIEARSRATSVQLDAETISDNPEAFQQFEQAQGPAWRSALSRLLVTVERYPQLAEPAALSPI